jgi:kynureninase
MQFENSLAFAQAQDSKDTLAHFRTKFNFPKHQGKDMLYFCGNSLGLQPKQSAEYVQQIMDSWANLAVEGHFKGDIPWMTYHKKLRKGMAEIVGAKETEVIAMNTLSVNLHFMMASFYRPSGKRNKILIEAGAFPSDQYTFETQAQHWGLNPDEVIVEVKPRVGEHLIRHEDIITTIEQHKDELAIVFFSGINYLTGQVFDMKAITSKAHTYNIPCGFDLAHAAGNIPLALHDWNVDFATWCSYKYMNSGPGGISGVFIHEKHGNNPKTPRFAGWWGYEEQTRFLMKKGFVPEPGADGWAVSNAPILLLSSYLASLKLFEEAGFTNLVAKSRLMTQYLEFIIEDINTQKGSRILEIVTPLNPEERGAQLSIICHGKGKALFNQLVEQGIIGDWREPNIIRFSPVPLYNNFEDVYRLGQALLSIL